MDRLKFMSRYAWRSFNLEAEVPRLGRCLMFEKPRLNITSKTLTFDLAPEKRTP
jgi:hypothetical protein